MLSSNAMKRDSDVLVLSSDESEGPIEDELDVMEDCEDMTKHFDDVIRDEIIPEIAAKNPAGA
jgi:hypothetical protein